jgi:hypothetical protein
MFQLPAQPSALRLPLGMFFLSAYLSICQSIWLPAYLSACPPPQCICCLLAGPHVCRLTDLLSCLPMCLFVCESILLSQMTSIKQKPWD